MGDFTSGAAASRDDRGDHGGGDRGAARDAAASDAYATYDRAASALRLALERSNQTADRIIRRWAAGRPPTEPELAEYRRRSAALKYAEAVWQAEADALIVLASRELQNAC